MFDSGKNASLDVCVSKGESGRWVQDVCETILEEGLNGKIMSKC